MKARRTKKARPLCRTTDCWGRAVTKGFCSACYQWYWYWNGRSVWDVLDRQKQVQRLAERCRSLTRQRGAKRLA